MSPEMTVAIVSAGSALLLVTGSMIIGRALAQASAVKQRLGLAQDLEHVRALLRSSEQATTEARDEAARVTSELDTLAAELEAQWSTDVKNERLKTERALNELQEVRSQLEQESQRVAELMQTLDGLEELRARVKALETERDRALERVRQLEQQPKGPAAAPPVSSDGQRDLKMLRDNEHKLRELVRQKDMQIETLRTSQSKESTELTRLRKELESTRERLSLADRVMEGVRARSATLAQELKTVKEELATLKRSQAS